jgi:hypothetical protein
MTSTCRPHVRWTTVLMFAILASGAARADTVALKANLQPSSEVPPRVSKGHGTVDATFDTDTKVFTWTATYAELSGPRRSVRTRKCKCPSTRKPSRVP